MSFERPSYEGGDTDPGFYHQAISPADSPNDSGKPQILDDTKEKYTDAEPEYIPPPYDGEHDRKASVAVETAEDLVTRVIDVEDDPTMNVWTFRMWFLGRSRYARLQSSYKELLRVSAISSFCLKELQTDNVAQVLACRPLAPSCRRFSISSRRPSTSLWFS